MLAMLGTFGMAGSGLLWNFQGLAFGLTSTLTAAVALRSLVFFGLGAAKASKQRESSAVINSTTTVDVVAQNPTSQTTAEALPMC